MHIRLVITLLLAALSIVMLGERFGVDGVTIPQMIEKYAVEDELKLVRINSTRFLFSIEILLSENSFLLLFLNNFFLCNILILRLLFLLLMFVEHFCKKNLFV